MSTSPRIEISPLCAELRSKKYYFLDGPPRSEDELLDASGAARCALSAQAVGPDGRRVDPRDCVAGRACFRPQPGAAGAAHLEEDRR